MSEYLHVGMRVLARQAGNLGELAGVVTYGPAQDRDGTRGAFVKVWIRFDGGADEVPWPVEDVRPEQADQDHVR